MGIDDEALQPYQCMFRGQKVSNNFGISQMIVDDYIGGYINSRIGDYERRHTRTLQWDRHISHDFAEHSENKTEMLNCKTLKTMGKMKPYRNIQL